LKGKQLAVFLDYDGNHLTASRRGWGARSPGVLL
jgi:hypothetical protein